MGIGADMSDWAEENNYKGDDTWGAWVEDLQSRAFSGYCIEDLEANEACGLKWNQEKRKWLQVDSPKKKARVVRTSTHATCLLCQQQKPRLDFSKRQWKMKVAQARCM
eukprot:CAMPEP_0194430560 /NCGR_PEP_ID=MMETSP0176-20130528/56564_1 /TAXON_ID=216777 /ORGANISM="Proboscia alata, Strain PI-D3" /LENGTH=107 /DNA_ID=CAMNT_0039244965 /DNA_START=118 /DNA_END=438 /DNA_ORIENTATION=+